MSAIINRKRQRLSNSNQFNSFSDNQSNNQQNNLSNSQSNDSLSTTVAISNVTPSSSDNNNNKKRLLKSNIISLDSEDDEYEFNNNQNNNQNKYNFGVDYEYEDFEDDDIVDDDDDDDEDDYDDYEEDSSLSFFSRTSSDSSSSSFPGSSSLQFLTKFSKNPPSLDFLSKKLLPNNNLINNHKLKLKSNNNNNQYNQYNQYSQYNQYNQYNQYQYNQYYPKKSPKLLPQLAYSKLTYEPLGSRKSILQKVNEVKAIVIPPISNNNHNNNNNNYTYGNSINYNRKPSFNNPFEQSLNFNNDINSINNFEEINNELENCDDKNGHYIIQPGSSFANNRFKLDSLLGQGTFGKVVKAYDKKFNKIVAIKIIKAIPKYREASKIELRVLSMLKKHDPNNLYQCIHFRECFDYRDHICIVTDILQKSLYDFLDDNQFLSFPGSHIQAIAKQLIRSVTFLHDLNIIHTDLKPENILLKDDRFILKNFKNPLNNELIQRKILINPKIYTIDFGSAIFDDEFHSDLVSTRHYRAPEIILGIGWSHPCDIWSLGCILVELITGEAIFKTHENPQHLAMMEKLLNKPIDIKIVFECFNKFFNNNLSNGNNNESNKKRRKSSIITNNSFDSNSIEIIDCFNKQTGKLIFPLPFTSEKLIKEVEELPNLCDLIGLKLGFKFDLNYSFEDSLIKFNILKKDYNNYEFYYYLLDLIFKMLCYNPKDRITAYDALNHHWFNLGIYDDGTV